MNSSHAIPVPETHTSHATTASNFEKYLFRAYLALLVWAPLPYASVNTWAWAIMAVWAYGLAGVWLWARLRRGQPVPRAFVKARSILLIWLAWLTWIAFQCLPLPLPLLRILSPQSAYLHGLTHAAFAPLSVDPHSTFDGLLLGTAYVLVFALTLLLVNSGPRLRMLAYTLVFSGLFQALSAILISVSQLDHFLFLDKTISVGMLSGTFVNRNHLAGYLEMCLAVGIGAMIAQLSSGQGKRSWRQHVVHILTWLLTPKIRLRAYLMLMVIALVMTRSRMGNSAFFASLLIAGGITLFVSRHRPNRPMVILLASLMVIDVLIVSSWFGLDEVAQRMEATDMTREQSRLMPDAQSLSYGKDYWLTGSGLGSYYVTYFRYEGSFSGYQNHAHNDYVQFTYETGVIGISLLAAAVLSSYYVALSALRQRQRSWHRGMAFGVLMGITALLIHSDADFNLQIPANASTFMVILALGWVARYMPSHVAKQPEIVAPKSDNRMVIGASAMLVCVACIVAGRGLADVLATKADARLKMPSVDGNFTKSLEGSESPLALAKTLDPGNAKLSRQMGEVYSWRVATTQEPAKKRELNRQMLQYQVKSAEQRPVSPFIWTDILVTKDRLGEHDAEFLVALEKAVLLGPWDPSVQYRIVDIGLTS
jgi:O-antigen ligase